MGRSLVSHTAGGTQVEGVQEKGDEEIFGAKRDDVTGDWRRLHNKELCALHQILFG